MNTMTDAELDAFGSPPARATPGGAARARRRRWWPWALLAMALLFVASVVAGVFVLGEALDEALGGLNIHVDGERVLAMPKGEAAWWALAAALLAAMVVLVVVPLSLLLAVLIIALALAAVVLVALVVAAVALSPLWVLALLLWLALREPRLPTRAA